MAAACPQVWRWHFNPHAPRGARHLTLVKQSARSLFQSTRPAWGATGFVSFLLDDVEISIHTPRVGRDNICGRSCRRKSRFQSTRPAWGATLRRRVVPPPRRISIHTPRVGRDLVRQGSSRAYADFNPHAPRGARRKYWQIVSPVLPFQSTRPAWGATTSSRRPIRTATFQSTRPAWGATVPVYTGLIAAVTLYFSRTSFLAVLLQAFFVAKSSV